MTGVRLTPQLRLVLRQAAQDPGREWYGREMATATGLPGGTVYPMIARLVRFGLLSVRAEVPGERDGARGPVRRYHRLTEAGLLVARVVSVAASGDRVDRTAPVPWADVEKVLEAAS